METPVCVASWIVVVAARPAKPCNWRLRRGSKMWSGFVGTMSPPWIKRESRFPVLWTGNGGRVYFYQSETHYDPPHQPSYTSAPGTNGGASYKVAENVTSHEAWGLGIYSVFRNRGVVLSRAIEVPNSPNVRFHSMITVRLGNNGEIGNVINDTGGATAGNPRVTPKVTNFP